MKKLIAFVLVCLLCCPAALAAEWAEGRSAAQPYEGVPEINLSESMGYAVRYPRDKMPARVFCDTVQIYLPREDIVRGEGKLTVHRGKERLAVIDFADEASVTVEPLSEEVCANLRWGGGTCISAKLPVSLSLTEEYYITMDEGCFRTVDGNLPNPPITENAQERWIVTFEGDYGVSGLYYSKGLDGDKVGDTILADAVQNGDKLTFDLVIGGDAVAAVVFSDNDSVRFEQPEYEETTTIRASVVGDELNWGVVFLDVNGNVLETVRQSK